MFTIPGKLISLLAFVASLNKGLIICGVIIVRALNPWSGQIKDYEIDICCFSAKHAALWSKSNLWLARNHSNASEWNNVSNSEMLFQWANTIKISLRLLVLYKAHILSLKCNLFSPWYSWQFARLVLNNNHTLTHIPYW